jgi:hypothetical protein
VVSDQQAQTGERVPRVSTNTLMIATVLLILVLARAASLLGNRAKSRAYSSNDHQLREDTDQTERDHSE